MTDTNTIELSQYSKVEEIFFNDEKNNQFLNNIKEDMTAILSKNLSNRTESQVRYSVLNETDCPTIDSKYWQLNLELSSLFTHLIKSANDYKKALLDLEEIEAIKEELAYANLSDKIKSIRSRRIDIDIEERKTGLYFLQKNSEQKLQEIKTLYNIYLELKEKLEYSSTDPNEHHIEAILLKVIKKIEYSFFINNNKVDLGEISELLGLLKSFKIGAEKNNITEKIKSKLTKIQLKIFNEEFALKEQ